LLATRFGRPLVCTSGNDDGEPLLYDECAAQRALAGIADAWLHHNRPIAHPIDDSVVRIIADRPVTLRLARGLAPLSLEFSVKANQPILALGGHLKVAAAWSNGAQAVLGPHVGSLDTLAARERYLEQLDAWQTLYRFRPALLVHDLHPDYFTTQWAAALGVPTLAVQHHHAHVVASMLEHRWLDRTVLGVAWDGAGYGPDGTIWGGEFLVATATEYQRLARLRPFQLPGGDRCAREPWRTAFSLLTQTVGNEAARALLHRSVTNAQARVLLQVLNATSNASPVTTSAGRLFDAAAYLCLGIDRVEYEGQAAMLLEAATIEGADGEYRFPLVADELDWRPLLQDLLADRCRGERPGLMAFRFHRALASGIASVCRTRPDLPVTLSGGVFQNRVLTELVADKLADHPQPLGLPGVIPVGDGGLAAGQLAIASARLSQHQERTPCA
jgi:hydrogenase maturation protein HypF